MDGHGAVAFVGFVRSVDCLVVRAVQSMVVCQELCGAACAVLVVLDALVLVVLGAVLPVRRALPSVLCHCSWSRFFNSFD